MLYIANALQKYRDVHKTSAFNQRKIMKSNYNDHNVHITIRKYKAVLRSINSS